jgi:hypothetical protein
METVKFYTKARRIPTLIGKMPSGGKIWGGPYTMTQGVVGGVAGLVMWKTSALWAHFGALMNIVVAAGIVYGLIWSAGKIPATGRNPFTWAMSAMNVSTRPGQLAGGRVAVARPRLVTPRITVAGQPQRATVPPTPTAAAVPPTPHPARPAPAPASSPRQAAPTPVASAIELTGVGQLLAGAITRKDHHNA